MKLFAHVESNGNIQGLIASPKGEITVTLTPMQGIKVYEITDHGIKGDEVDLHELEQLLKENTVHVAHEKGKLVKSDK